MYVGESDDDAWAVAGPEYVRFLEGAKEAAGSASGAPPAKAANPFDTEDLKDAVIFGSPDTCAEYLGRLHQFRHRQRLGVCGSLILGMTELRWLLWSDFLRKSPPGWGLTMRR